MIGRATFRPNDAPQPLRARMEIRCTTKHGRIEAEVVRGGLNAFMPHHLGDRHEVGTAAKQLRGEGRTEQVRVVSRPWPPRLRRLQAREAAGRTQRPASISVDNHPDRAAIPQRPTEPGHEQRAMPPVPSVWATLQVVLQQPAPGAAIGHQPVLPTLAANEQRPVHLHVAYLEPCQLAGTQAALVERCHDHVVTEADERRQIRRRQQPTNLGIRQRTRQPLRRTAHARPFGRLPRIWVQSHQEREPRPQRADLQVQRRRCQSPATGRQIPPHRLVLSVMRHGGIAAHHGQVRPHRRISATRNPKVPLEPPKIFNITPF